MENFLMGETPSGPMPVFVAAPAGEGPRPVVIVLQEAFGVNEHIKNICERLSQEGYLAVAPELYHRLGRHVSFAYTDKEGFYEGLASLTNESLVEDVRATLDFLKSLPTADPEQVFTLGFCMGGFASLLSATELKVKGAISFYGAGVVREREGIGYHPFVRRLRDIPCPVLLFFGDEDASIPEADRIAIRSALGEAHVPHDLVMFSGADHGFFCEERKTYHEAAAKEAWTRSLEFLSRLRPAVP